MQWEKISAAKENHKEQFAAKNLYDGPTFKLARDVGWKKYDCEDFYIISAKHHLLNKNEIITWYNVKLESSVINKETGKKTENGKEWADNVLKKLRDIYDLKNTMFYIFAGKNYYKHLSKHLNCKIFNYNGKRVLGIEDLLEDDKLKTFQNGGK